MSRPIEQERKNIYFDLKKAKDLYLRNNPIVKSFTTKDLHDAYLKANPNNYISYQTFINWDKKGFKQLEAFMSITKIVGAKSIDALLTVPKQN